MSDDGTEWEYEYDPEETEAHYVTLDLTSHLVPSMRGKRNGSAKSNKDADTKTDKVAEQISQEAESDVNNVEPKSKLENPLQIVDLHGDNPLIAYNKQVYSCNWATDVGTSVFLSAPIENPETDYTPLRSFKTFDLVGLTSARLTAVPVKVRSRLVPLSAARRDDNHEYQHVTTLTDGEVIKFSNERGLQIDLPPNADAEKISQARFLERLSTLKRQRGQMDAVPVKAIKAYTRPENWAQEREEYLARERAERAQREAEAVPVSQNEAVENTGREGTDDTNAAGPEDEAAMSLTQLFKSRKRVRRSTAAVDKGLKEAKTKRPPGRPWKIKINEETGPASGAEHTPMNQDQTMAEAPDNTPNAEADTQEKPQGEQQ